MNESFSESKIFDESIENGRKRLRFRAELSRLVGESPEELKKAQEIALVRLYRRQMLTAITICCLVRKKGLRGFDPDQGIKISKKTQTCLIEMGEMSEIDPKRITEELYFLEDEKALQRLQELMNQMHQNCVQIAQSLAIEFNESKKEVNTEQPKFI